MMFKIRTTPVQEGTQPYKWGIDSVYQCVWYVFYRCLEVGFSPCEWWSRETQTGSYYHAKTWLQNYRDPWQVKGPDYQPVAGDIAVYDGEYGHVQFMETAEMYSEYSNGDPNSFRNGKLSEYRGKLLGFLHYPFETIQPVERNPKVNQIKTTDEGLRIRLEPSLSAEIVGYVQIGYYNVLATKKADGYTWYRIGEGRWCADVTTEFLPKDDDDIIRQLEEYFRMMKVKVQKLEDEKEDLNGRLDQIREICDGRNNT